MKGLLDKDGSLLIERAGALEEQYCPWVVATVSCGDWCPHFGEPETAGEDGLSRYLKLTCGNNSEWLFSELEDQR